MENRMQWMGLVAALLCACCATSALAAQRLGQPHILLALADNWAYPHAGAYGDRTVRTPTFDRLAREGVLLTHAFCDVPSCSPARAVLLTGQATHRLEDAANLWSLFPRRLRVYPDLLKDAGYHVGHMGKGWAPGNFKESGWTENPAGKVFKSFAAFLEARPADRPFCFWMGIRQPHRSYAKGVGAAKGLMPDHVVVPPCLPDTPDVRNDILDYYEAVGRADQQVGEALELLQQQGLLEDTMVIFSSDNGWQMPRGLANVYDTGTRIPLAVRWGKRLPAGRKVDDLVSLVDLAPTFLELAGLRPLPPMDGRSLLDLLMGKSSDRRDAVFLERERHANVRRGDLTYPVRAIRTHQFLYIRNLRPDRWPAGDPQLYHAVGDYGDVDDNLPKQLILARAAEPEFKRFYDLSFAKRPGEELYDLRTDPDQLVNVAARPEYTAVKRTLGERIDQWMRKTADPRLDPGCDVFDKYPYFGPRFGEAPPPKPR